MQDKYELRESSEKGEGIFAIQTIKTGETVMVGAIKEWLDKNHSHASQIGIDKFAFHGGLIVKVNHSCNPNCGIKENETGAHDFVAMKNISIGEEITFDYAMRNYTVDYFPKQCMCGADNCRGEITGWKSLSATEKLQYKGFVAPYLLELDLQEEQKLSDVNV